MCVGAFGSISRNAIASSVSATFVDGISPRAILQKRQLSDM
jgi:hypothetical protein